MPGEPEPQPPESDGHQLGDDAMSGYSRLDEASRIASRFLPEGDVFDVFEVVGMGLRAAIGERVALADVSATTERYLIQESLSIRYGLPIPAVVVDGEDPLPAGVFPVMAGGFAETHDLPYEGVTVAAAARDRLARDAERAGASTVDLAPESARRHVRGRLARFLERRLAAQKEAAGPSAPGLPFRVVTRGPGLRIHWSPAYFFEPGHVFAFGLSTPVDGWLAPGRYIFGAVGPMQPLEWEFDATYDLPDARVANLLRR
jgi:hypothetical protein